MSQGTTHSAVFKSSSAYLHAQRKYNRTSRGAGTHREDARE